MAKPARLLILISFLAVLLSYASFSLGRSSSESVHHLGNMVFLQKQDECIKIGDLTCIEKSHQLLVASTAGALKRANLFFLDSKSKDEISKFIAHEEKGRSKL